MKRVTRRLLGTAFGDYRINWIFAADRPAPLPLSAGETVGPVDAALAARIAASPTGRMRNSLGYGEAGMTGLALIRDGQPLCVAHLAGPAHYDRAGTWPLHPGELALMDVVTEDAARGHGLAPRLIAATTRAMLTGDTRRTIAFVWWSNTPSIRAFAKAGWRRIGFSIEWRMAGRSWHLHVPLPGRR